MAWVLTVDVVPKGGGPVVVQHEFWGGSEAEARAAFKSHAEGCEFLGPAIAEGRIEEEIEEVEDADRPEYDVEGDEDAADEEDEDDDEESATDEGELDT